MEKDAERKEEQKTADTLQTQNVQTEVKQVLDEETKSLKNDKPVKSSPAKQQMAKTGTRKYKMGGPIGTFLMTLLLPAFVLGLNFLCNKNSCTLPFGKLPSVPKILSSYYDRNVTLVLLGYFVFQMVLACLPIGRLVKQESTPGQKAHTVRCNGFLNLFLTLAILGGLIYAGIPVSIIHDKFFQMTVSGTVFAFIVSCYAFIRSRKLKPEEKFEHGNTGCTMYDFFVGRELHPRLGPVDLKFFIMRYGIICWVTMNALFLWKSYAVGSLTPALVFVVLMQLLYALDYVWHEGIIANNFEMKQAGFGFNLIFVFIAMVPFTYCLQARFLLEHPVKWNPFAVAGFFLLNMIGYIIFRGANSEKTRFRRDPHNPVYASFKKIPSPSGQKLLASGWWGLCRHPNYLGDIIMAVAWTIPCGWNDAHLVYCYPILLTLLLLARAAEMESLCQKKHGSAWERYCREVKYKLIPYVY